MVLLSKNCRSYQLSLSAAACVALFSLIPTTATAQLFDTIGGVNVPSTGVRSPILSNDTLFISGADDFIVDSDSAWVRHIGGGGPGWQPFTSIGGSIPFFADNGALIVEAQGLITNDGNGGGSFGLNRRFFIGDNLIGAGFAYDVNQSPNERVFHQTVFSLELFRDDWTFRGNGYLPVGPRVRNVQNATGLGSSGNVQFENNNLIGSDINTFRLDETAMRGIDIEIARSVGSWSGEVFVGYYNFQGRIGGTTNGIKGGVRGYVTPRLAGNVAVADDPIFGTNVYGGFTWFLGGTGGSAPRTIEDKLTIPVERNQQVVINEVSSGINIAGPIILTSNGQPITITHINQNAGGSNLGTFENPFLGLPPTQNTDIVYVHADGTYSNQSYSLNPNQRFLGEGNGNNHFVVTDQLGQITLPPGNGGVNRPVIRAVDGQYVLNSAANTEISNIDIDNTGAGLRGGIFANAGSVNVNRALISGGFTGIDIIGGTGQFTFTDVSINDQTDRGLLVDGGTSNITFDPTSGITQGIAGTTVQVQGGHTGILQFDGDITATDGDGLQFDDADGQYDFRGQVQLNGSDAGIDILGDSAGTFTFTDTTITNPTGNGLFVDGGSSTVIFDGLSSISKNNPGSTVRVQGGHDGTFTFNPGTGITATDGDGLQFDDADGQYNFRGQVQLNGGDAGIDILGDSAGTFTFRNTDITSPTGTAFKVENLDVGGTVNFNGNINATSGGDLIDIDTTAAGSQINFNSTGANSIFGNGAGGIVIFDADGDIAFTTPVTISNPVNGFLQSGVSIFGGSGTIGFTDTTVQLPNAGFNAGVEINGHSGTLTFNNLDITTDGPGIVGLSVFNAGTLNITGSNTINSTGGDGIAADGVGTINMTFDSVTVTNSTSGFGGGSGITLTGIGGGTFDVTGTTTIHGANGPAGIGIDIDDSAGTFTFSDVDIDMTTLDGIAVGTLFGNPGTMNINGGTVANAGSNGVTVNNAGGFNLFNTTFNSITGFTADLTGSTVSGNGNTAIPFSSNNGGGNTGTILFNGGADSAP